MSRFSRLLPIAVAATLTGCATVKRTPAPQAGRDELLVATGDAVWRGDLVAAHQVLARLADRERGVADPALDFWSELLALLRCEPLARTPRAESAKRPLADPWDRLRRLVQIERVRLGREGAEAAKAVALSNPKQQSGRDYKQVVWPVEREHWSDELPLPAVVSRCADGARPDRPAGEAASEAEVALVAGVATSFPLEHPATPLLLVQAAVLEIARGRAAAAVGPLARLEGIAQPPTGPLTAAERSAALTAAALAAIGDPATTIDAALIRGRAAMAAESPSDARRALQFLLFERLSAAGRIEEATAVLGPPPHGDDDVGHYMAFRQAEAHARAGRRAPLLAEAREALHRLDAAAVESDPALLALRDLALRTLLASPVSPETVEVLESLGPVHERLRRAEVFAAMALEAGGHHSAMAMFSWLYANDNDSRRQLQHLARASVAAARSGDRGEFARTFRTLAGQEQTETKAKGEAKPKGEAKTAKTKAGGMIATPEAERDHQRRRAARSVNWQRALLVVARDALSALVENDDQANLATLVETLKRHLEDGGRGPVDEELTTLYRAASAHLKTGARAYAETVGAERRPILLGDVLIGRSYKVGAPKVNATGALREVGPVVFVPRRGNDPSPSSVQRWPATFGVAWTGGRS